MQQELDLHGFEREFDTSIFRAIQNARAKKCGDIRMNRFHVSSNTSRSLAN